MDTFKIAVSLIVIIFMAKMAFSDFFVGIFEKEVIICI